MTDLHVSLTIVGEPAPQGSKTAVSRGGRAWVIEGGSQVGRDKHRAWRDACTAAALPHRRPEADADRPVEVSIGFRMPRPASKPKYRSGTPCEVKPDLDKLIRCTLDGLADGGLLPGGDSRVVAVEASKFYVEDGQSPGADVDVWFSDVPAYGGAA